LKRRLLNLLTALSLVLCVAAAALWVRSERFQDKLQVRPRDGGSLVVHVFWARGKIACTQTYGPANGVLAPGRRVQFEADRGRFPPVDLYANWKARGPAFYGGGFAVLSAAPESGARGGVLVPLWSLTSLLAVPPALWLTLKVRRRLQRREGRERGRCRSCGYDLRATPNRCPECGLAGGPADGR
jgi:hypothetical protein